MSQVSNSVMVTVRRRCDLDQVMVGHVDPARVVVERLAGDDDAVVGTQDAERVAPAGGEDAVAVGDQQVQPRSRVSSADVDDELPDLLRSEVGKMCGKQRRVAHRFGRGVRAEYVPVHHAVVRQQPAPAENGATADLLHRHPDRRGTHRRDHARRGDRRGHRRERRIAPERSVRAPPSRARAAMPAKKPTPHPSAFISPWR